MKILYALKCNSSDDYTYSVDTTICVFTNKENAELAALTDMDKLQETYEKLKEEFYIKNPEPIFKYRHDEIFDKIKDGERYQKYLDALWLWKKQEAKEIEEIKRGLILVNQLPIELKDYIEDWDCGNNDLFVEKVTLYE